MPGDIQGCRIFSGWVSVNPGTPCQGCGEPLPARYMGALPRAYRDHNGNLYGDSCCGNQAYWAEARMPEWEGEEE